MYRWAVRDPERAACADHPFPRLRHPSHPNGLLGSGFSGILRGQSWPSLGSVCRGAGIPSGVDESSPSSQIIVYFVLVLVLVVASASPALPAQR